MGKGRSNRTPRKLKKELAKQGLVEMWFDLSDASIAAIKTIAELQGLDPNNKNVQRSILTQAMTNYIAKEMYTDGK